MFEIREGQCGLCVHFGERHPQQPQLVEMRIRRAAPESYVDTCNHPQHEALNLKVTPISGCDGFEPVQQQELKQSAA